VLLVQALEVELMEDNRPPVTVKVHDPAPWTLLAIVGLLLVAGGVYFCAVSEANGRIPWDEAGPWMFVSGGFVFFLGASNGGH